MSNRVNNEVRDRINAAIKAQKEAKAAALKKKAEKEGIITEDTLTKARYWNLGQRMKDVDPETGKKMINSFPVAGWIMDSVPAKLRESGKRACNSKSTSPITKMKKANGKIADKVDKYLAKTPEGDREVLFDLCEPAVERLIKRQCLDAEGNPVLDAEGKPTFTYVKEQYRKPSGLVIEQNYQTYGEGSDDDAMDLDDEDEEEETKDTETVDDDGSV